MGRNEVLQNVQAFTEVRGNRRFNNGAVRLGHQAAHAGELANLGCGTTSTGVGHHVDAVERFLTNLLAVTVDRRFGGELGHHHLAHLVGRAAPDVHHLVVAFTLGHETGRVLGFDFLDFLFGVMDELFLLSGDGHVTHADGDAGARRQTVAVVLELVGEHDRRAQAALAEAAVDQLGDLLLLQGDVEFLEAHAFRQDFGEESAADGGFVTNHARGLFTRFLVDVVFADTDRAAGLEFDNLVVPGALNFGDVGKEHALALAVDLFTRSVVETEHHVLRRHDRRIAVGREQDVVGGHHQRAGFKLGFERERHVNGHLVTVEVGIEGGADERMQLEGLAFDQLGLERLNAETVQRRSTVEHDRVFVDHLFEDVPDDRILVLNHLLGSLRRHGETAEHELVEDERLEELESHELRQTALVQTEFRTHRNNGTAGVVHALAEQVLTEAAALALDHVGEGLERALVGTGHRLAAAAVVEQRVDGFLQHALFVAHDDVRSLDLEEALQTVVTVDDAAVQVVQVGRREAAAVKGDERTQVRRKNREDRHDHPFGLDAGALEAFKHLEALGELLDLGFGARLAELGAQTFDFLIDVDRAQELADGFSAHHGDEVVTEFGRGGNEVLFAEQLATLERGKARINDDVGFEVQHALDVAQRDVEHHAHTARKALEEPDVSDRAGEVDVTHAFAANLGERDFNATLFADHAAILEALVLAAKALIILHRAKDLGTEKTVAFRLLGTIVNRLRLLDFTVGPGVDLFGTGKSDADRVEMIFRLDLVEDIVKRHSHRLISP